MRGYFITKKQANELGLMDNPEIASKLQKVIIAVTDKDVLDYYINQGISISELSEKKIEETAEWFYKNYYDAFLESNFQK